MGPAGVQGAAKRSGHLTSNEYAEALESGVMNNPAASESQPENVGEIDPMLAVITDFVENEQAEIPVTLCVSGMIISGVLVSKIMYFEHMAKRLAEHGNQQAADYFARPIAQILRARKASDSEGEQARSFVHLRDALVITSTGEPPLSEMYWRGRLSQVSAWSFNAVDYQSG